LTRPKFKLTIGASLFSRSDKLLQRHGHGRKSTFAIRRVHIIRGHQISGIAIGQTNGEVGDGVPAVAADAIVEQIVVRLAVAATVCVGGLETWESGRRVTGEALRGGKGNKQKGRKELVKHFFVVDDAADSKSNE
jgi:hypothetical protein